jgi:5-methyltetrahydrofolate corrinoid/iron sulfur protein methyltransferase
MLVIGENINIMSKSLGPAMRERNAKPIQEMALAEVAAGVDILDLNIGPARRDGDKLMEWIVQVVQEVTDTPLSLDTTNPVAMEAGLKVCKSKALINSISLQPARLESELPLVNKYKASMIGLLWGQEGMPRDANERCAMAVEIVYKANELGISNEDIWIDPIVSPVSVEINQVKSCIEFMSMLSEIAPGCKSVVGLSNISNGAPGHLRPYLNRAYLLMLMKHGLYSAISDATDDELIKIAKGGMPEITKLVWGMMDGDQPDMAKLSPKELEYAKTVRVLTAQSLYSHSWLEI